MGEQWQYFHQTRAFCEAGKRDTPELSVGFWATRTVAIDVDSGAILLGSSDVNVMELTRQETNITPIPNVAVVVASHGY